MLTDREIIIAVLLKSVFLIKSDGAFVLAEDAEVDLGGLANRELLKGPGHKKVTEAVAEKSLAEVELPDLHGVREWVYGRDVNGANFNEGDEVVFMLDDLVNEARVGEFCGDDLVGVGFGEEGLEVGRFVEWAEGFDEGVAAEAGERGDVAFGGGAE